jgi:molecular chaperone DnaK
MKDAGDKLPADVKSGIDEKLEALKKVKDGEDLAAIQTALANLSAEIQKIGQAMYNKDNGHQASDGGGDESGEREPGQAS